jgi:anti-sigma factor RsiW
MNHPKPEEWVPFMSGETNAATRRQLQAHLKECPQCQAQIEGWKRSVSRLHTWKLSRSRKPLELFLPALKWAVAACLMLAIGFLFGRYAGSDAVVDKVRARLEPQLREVLYQEMAQLVRQEVGRSSSSILLASSDQTDRLLAAYNTLNETRRAQDLERLYLALKKQLDTVAINTEREFVQLTSFQPGNR